VRRLALLALLLCAPAAQADDQCLSATPPAPAAAPKPLRFGITPALAGTAGSTQGSAAPVDAAKELSALRALRPRRRTLVVRLNRLFEAEAPRRVGRFHVRLPVHPRRGRELLAQPRRRRGARVPQRARPRRAAAVPRAVLAGGPAPHADGRRRDGRGA